MDKLTTKVLLLAIIILVSAGSAMAQMQWTDFAPSQSRVKFDPPGLSAQPTRAFEGINISSTKRNVRNFGYAFNKTGGDTAFAQVYLFSIAAEMTYFTDPPNFDGVLQTFYQEFKGQTVSWTDQQRLKAPSPIGGTEYRRFSGLGKSCVVFGGLYGRSSTAGFNSAASGTSGTEQLMGYYCAAKGHTLSAEDAKVVLSRLSVDGLGKAQGSGVHRFPDADIVTPQAATPSQPASATVSNTIDIRRVVVLWDGRPSPLRGTLTIESSKNTSRLEIQLPGQTGTCLGVSALERDESGKWAVECPDGTTGHGAFRSTGRDGGFTGEGTDNKGARISFSIAGRG
jgi:hypothetical protein